MDKEEIINKLQNYIKTGENKSISSPNEIGYPICDLKVYVNDLLNQQLLNYERHRNSIEEMIVASRNDMKGRKIKPINYDCFKQAEIVLKYINSC